MRRFSVIYLAVFLLFSAAGCKYQKILKEGTPEEKLTAAKKYYNKEDYNRALPLLDGLLGTYRKRSQAEEIYYYFSYTHYGLGDFIMASYNFKNFVKNYPNSKYTEECAFMVAKCSYHQTLPYFLDQTHTRKAIESVQLFINRYPQSSYVEEGNKLIDELRSKLHKKAYSNSTLYYKMGNYKSSYVAFKNAIADYPDIPEKEEIEFLVVKSAYLYAGQSFQSAQLERYNIALEEALLFLDGEVQNKSYRKQIAKIIDESRKKIAALEEISSAAEKN